MVLESIMMIFHMYLINFIVQKNLELLAYQEVDLDFQSVNILSKSMEEAFTVRAGRMKGAKLDLHLSRYCIMNRIYQIEY